ncbi:MAG: 5'/3'-nucleotidase SurE [Ignavibacteriae bacterium]|nr:5'/3'-nucleotidase SurE [Ignavibacteriota bacterium]
MRPTQKKLPHERPIILVSNDDGYDSPGIYALVMAMRPLGDVVVAAPATQQSAVGHAITMQMPLRAREIRRGMYFRGWAVEGTPADSVKLGATTLLPRLPDLVVSGINHGMNTSINIIYSGTVSAATEGAILGIPSIAFSLATHALDADLRGASRHARVIASTVLKNGLPRGTLLNVNVPNIPANEIRGIKVTRQGRSWWDDGFESRSDPNGRTYYWLFGSYVWDSDSDADDVALRNGFVSVTPLHYSLTDETLLRELQEWKFTKRPHREGVARTLRGKKG